MGKRLETGISANNLQDLNNKRTKQSQLSSSTNHSDNKTLNSVPDAVLGVPRRTGWVPSRYPDQKHSGFRRSPSNEPIIHRSKDEPRGSGLGYGLNNMEGGEFLDPVSPLSPFPNQGDGSKKVGELAELEAPNLSSLLFRGKRRGSYDSSIFSDGIISTRTNMSSYWVGSDAGLEEPKERVEERRDEQLSASSPTSIVTVKRIIPETQHDPSAEYRSHGSIPWPWPLVDDRSLMQDRSGAWRQDARTVASSEQSWPIVGKPPSMPDNPEIRGRNEQTIFLPVGLWPPVEDKPFMQESSGAWVEDARTKVFPDIPDTFGGELSIENKPGKLEQDTQLGAWIQDEQTMASPDNTPNLEMKPKQVSEPQLQTTPLAKTAVIESEPLQKGSVDIHEEMEESTSSVQEYASPDLRPESRGWLGFLDEIVEDSSTHEHHITLDPKITQGNIPREQNCCSALLTQFTDDEVNDAVKIKPIEVYPDDSTQIPESSPESSDRLIEDTSTKSKETEKRTILSSWWLRFMNFCDPPPSGFQRILYECVSCFGLHIEACANILLGLWGALLPRC